MKKIKLGARDVIGLLVSLFFLWLTVKDFSFDREAWHWNQFSLTYLLLCLLCVMLPTYINAFRFSIFFEEFRGRKKVNIIPSFFIGNFYNEVLPGNLGEAVKLYHLEKKYNMRRKKLLAIWANEKFLGAMVFPLMFILPLLRLENAYIKMILCILMTIVYGIALYVYLTTQNKFLRKLPFRFLPVVKVRRYAYSVFHIFLHVLKQTIGSKRVWGFWMYSILYLFVVILLILCTVHAVGIPAIFASPEALLLVASIILISSFLPSLPSSAGVMHYGIYKSFVILASHYSIEVTPELNNLFVIGAATFHLVIFCVEVALGLPFVIIERKWLFGKKNSI